MKGLTIRPAMKKCLPVIIFFVVCASCKQNDADEKIAAINSSLISSNKLISYNNNRVYDFLHRRLLEFWTPENRNTWEPVLHEIRELSAGTVRYLDSLVQQLHVVDNKKALAQLLNNEADELYRIIQAYNGAVVKTPEPAISSRHPNLQIGPKKDIAIIKKGIDPQAELADNFKHLTSWQAIATLHKLKADVLITESNLLSYCSTNIGYQRRPCDIGGGIAILNSSYAQAGKLMQAFVGTGYFSLAGRPVIVIGDKKVALNSEGVAVYKFIAKGGPGKYSLPICIEYNKPDGSYAVIDRKLEYIIAQ